jgi:5-oxoprolinase (ATP-hydrolysing) subunit A
MALSIWRWLSIRSCRGLTSTTCGQSLGSATYAAAQEAGQPVVREFYADRDYDDSGSIVFTRDAGRPDPMAIAQKVLRACREGKVLTVTGGEIGIEFESICFHSDTLGALDIVRHMREALLAEGIRIAPVSKIAVQ